MGTKLTELRDGCFARALDDEPMFVLLARDPSAPDLTEDWAARRHAEIDNGQRPARDIEQVNEARTCARNMRAWRTENDGAWRTGFFGDADEPADPVMPELRDRSPRVELPPEFAPPRPRTGDAAYDYENADGSVLAIAVERARKLTYYAPHLRGKVTAEELQASYGLTDRKTMDIRRDINAALFGSSHKTETVPGEPIGRRIAAFARTPVKLPLWLIAAALVVGCAWNVATLRAVDRNSDALATFEESMRGGICLPVDPD